MTLRIPAKVLIHVWSYDFYDMTLATRKQRGHMINTFIVNAEINQTSFTNITMKEILLEGRNSYGL